MRKNLGICDNNKVEAEESDVFQTLDFKLIFPEVTSDASYSQVSDNYNINIDMEEPVSGFLSVAQATVLTIATDKGTDTVYLDKGTDIRERARKGAVVKPASLIHVSNFAFSDAVSFTNRNVISSINNSDVIDFNNYTVEELADMDKAISIVDGRLTPSALSADSVLFSASFESSKGETITTGVNTNFFV